MTLIGFARDQIVVTGVGAVTGQCDASPFLRTKKLRKFMGKQDQLAVVAAARALESAALAGSLGERCGLYMVVGYIPFEGEDIDRLTDASLDGGRVSMARFAANAFEAVHPLLTFRVLPNMPAFHVSLNFDIQGPYAVTYPGIAQLYTALEEAFAALESHQVDVALVGAVADQKNMLVEHHFGRVDPPVESSRLENASAFFVLERAPDAAKRGAPARATLRDWRLQYAAVDPFEANAPRECLQRDGACVGSARDFGPATLGIALAETDHGMLVHHLRSRDGFDASSSWEVS